MWRTISSVTHMKSFLETDRYERNTKQLATTIQKHFQVGDKDAYQLAGLVAFRFQNVETIDMTSIEQKVTLLKRHFATEDIFHNAKVFSVSSEELQQRISILLELGFEKPEIKLLYSLQYLLSQKLEPLKAANLYPSDTNPCRVLATLIEQDATLSKCCDTSLLKSGRQLSKGVVEGLTLREMRTKCLHLLLRDNILNSSDQVATHIVENLNSHRSLDKICLVNLLASIHILVNHIHLPIHHLIRYFSFYINCRADNLRRFAEIKYFRDDYNFRVAFFSRQRLVNLDADTIEKRLDHLVNNHNCTTRQIINCIFILEHTPDEVNQMFKQFTSCSQLSIFADSDDLLRLVLNFQTANDNLAKLNAKDIALKYINVSDLLKPSSKFAKMVNSNNFKLNLASFVQLHFGSSLKDLKNRIGHFKPSAGETLNSVNAEGVLNFFREQGLSDEQILNGIYVVYYDLDSIKSIWCDMFTRLLPSTAATNTTDTDDWRSHSHVLQLLFYFMEKSQKMSIV